jgi:hypothetical protein
MRTLHPCSWGRDHEQGLALCQERVLACIAEALVGWYQPAEVLYEGFQVIKGNCVIMPMRERRKPSLKP